MIRAVISDFGGVLTSPLIESFLAYQEESGVRFEDLGRAMMRIAERSGEHPLFELEKGRITEADFLSSIESELKGPVKLGSLRDTYFAHLRPNGPMIGYMRELRDRGLRMALLTNNVREWEPHWRSKLPDIDAIFEVVVDSAFVGMRKPERGIYELTLEQLGDGVHAEECVFVDDTDVNCDAAAELGMHAVRFRDSDQAIAELEELLSREA
ncbi:MAG: HAD family phosphatase [Actinobacteria bacterium]|nr:MAG: HAD family phosphatase [Actinomycetota bacterium]